MTACNSASTPYETAAKVLRAANVGGKLPSVAALQAEYAKLTEQKEALYADYGKLKKQVKEYDTIKRNIDVFLRIERQPEKKKLMMREKCRKNIEKFINL